MQLRLLAITCRRHVRSHGFVPRRALPLQHGRGRTNDIRAKYYQIFHHGFDGIEIGRTGGRCVGCGLGVGVCLGANVAVGVGVGVSVAVGVGVGVRVAVGVAVPVAVAVGVGVGVCVAVGVGVEVAVA